MVGNASIVHDEHVSKSSHWDVALGQNVTVGRQELRPDHAESFALDIVSGIEKVPPDVLARRTRYPTFIRAQKPIAHPERGFRPAVIAVRDHAS
jgi:hypothetical protein